MLDKVRANVGSYDPRQSMAVSSDLRNHTMTTVRRNAVLWMAFVSAASSVLFAQQNDLGNSSMSKRPMSVEDLFAFQRVGAPSISPDGRVVVYAVTEITDSKNNKSLSRLWLAPSDGSLPARQLTNSSAKDSNPKWSPDGRWIVFESTRSGSSQIWAISPFGGEATQLTSISTDGQPQSGHLMAGTSGLSPRSIPSSRKCRLPKATRPTK